MKTFHYTLKRAYPVTAARNSERTINLRYEYAVKFRDQETLAPTENFVFLDEVGFQVVTRPKRAHAPKGQTAYTFVSAARSRNISVMAACSKVGMLYHKIQSFPFNGETFKESLIELSGKCLEKGMFNFVFIMDNARIHHYQGLQACLEAEGLNIVFRLEKYCY